MKKKNIIQCVTLICMSIIVASACSEIDETPIEFVTETETSIEEISETEPVTEVIEIIDDEKSEKIPTPEIQTDNFFSIFGGNGAENGFIAKSLDEAKELLDPSLETKQLSVSNITKSIDEDKFSKTLFSFVEKEFTGLNIIKCDDVSYYYFKHKDAKGNEYNIIMGTSEYCTYEKALKYTSSEQNVSYLALGVSLNDDYYFLPVVAGNKSYGIYAVEPTLKMMDFDVPDMNYFSGIGDVYSIRVPSVDFCDGKLSVQYNFYSKRQDSKNSYFLCDYVYFNNENINSKIPEEFPIKLVGSGEFIIEDYDPQENSTLYFSGSVIDIETNEPIRAFDASVNIEKFNDNSSEEFALE